MHFSWLKMLIPGNNVPESNEHPLVASCLLSQLALSPDDPTTPLHHRSDFLPFLCESNVCLFLQISLKSATHLLASPVVAIVTL